MTIKTIRKVIQYLDDLDTGLGCTEREWLDILDELETTYGKYSHITKKRIDKYFKDN